MSKKKAKSHNTLSKSKFKKIVCKQQCLLCDRNKPTFCYTKLYKHNPDGFMSKMLPNLINNNELFAMLLTNPSATKVVYLCNMFKRLVCKSGVCKSCNISETNIIQCITHFIHQAGYLSETTGENKISNKKKPSPPKPCVMMSENLDFKKEVDKILENYSEQQNQAGGAITSP